MARESVDGKQPPHYHARALTRGLHVLRAVADAQRPLTFRDLHGITKLPKSTLVRILSVLEEDDYLIRAEPGPSFTLGHAVLPIATAYLGSNAIGDLFRGTLESLARATGWTANLGTLEGAAVVHLCLAFPGRAIQYSASEGSTAPTYCTGLGKAMLSGLSDARRAEVLPPAPFPRLTEHTIVEADDLAIELETTVKRGYAVDAEEYEIGLRCLAVPIRDGNVVVGAVSVSGPVGEATPDRERDLLKALMTARESIEKTEGLRGTLRFGRGWSTGLA